MRKPSKPCKNCHHKKGAHVYNADMYPGGNYIPALVTYPCQEIDCKCYDYQEMTLREKIEVFGY